MTDVVDMLRYMASLSFARVYLEAAREIERLRRALEEIEDLGADGATAARLSNIAAGALSDVRTTAVKP